MVALLVLSGLLNLAYYLPILRIAVFEPGDDRRVREPTAWLVAPPVFAALAAVVLGLNPDAGARFWFLAESAARSVAAHAPEFLTGGLPVSRRTAAGLGVVVAALAALDVIGFLSGAEHHGGIWNSVPLGDLALGALGAGVLVGFSKRILKRLLSRPESYYDRTRQP